MKRSTMILSALLVLSVSANLGVAGMMLGQHLRKDPGPIDRFLGAVPEPLRGDVRDTMRPDQPEARRQIEAMRAARREVNRALRERPFDAAAAETALARLREATGQAQEQLHRSIVERMAAAQAAGTLPPPPAREERGGRQGPPDGKPDRAPEDRPPHHPPPPPPRD